MQLIKKYANRKLYHTNRKQYITLEGIAELIQAGDEVQVVDNETSADITASILSQVVLQPRSRRGALPQQVLTDMIQNGGDRLAGLGRSVWAALSGGSVIDTEIKRRLARLHDEGALSAEEASRIQALLLQAGDDQEHHLLPQMPNQSDLARLSSQVDALNAAVEQLLAERKPRDD